MTPRTVRLDRRAVLLLTIGSLAATGCGSTARDVPAVLDPLPAALWGLLLFVTSPIAATPPVLAGLVAGRRLPELRRRRDVVEDHVEQPA